MKAGIKVFAPATVSNLACGFDVIGLALEKPGDEIIARFSDRPGLRITKITGAGGRLPFEVEKNTAGLAALRLLEHLGEEKAGIEMEIHKKMPFGSGLGSSAASSVAGAMAMNELLGRPLEKRALLPFAMEGEQVASGAFHADNVAPSLLGGIIFIRDNSTLDTYRIPAPKGLFVVVIYPEVEVLTKQARTLLKSCVQLTDAVTQSGNLGGLIIGLYNSDLSLIGRSLQDVIIEPQRAPLIPGFYEVKEASLEEGALGCSISGSGPSIFAICSDSLSAERVGVRMEKIYAEKGIPTKLFFSRINQEGAVLY